MRTYTVQVADQDTGEEIALTVEATSREGAADAARRMGRGRTLLIGEIDEVAAVPSVASQWSKRQRLAKRRTRRYMGITAFLVLFVTGWLAISQLSQDDHQETLLHADSALAAEPTAATSQDDAELPAPEAPREISQDASLAEPERVGKITLAAHYDRFSNGSSAVWLSDRTDGTSFELRWINVGEDIGPDVCVGTARYNGMESGGSLILLVDGTSRFMPGSDADTWRWLRFADVERIAQADGVEYRFLTGSEVHQGVWTSAELASLREMVKCLRNGIHAPSFEWQTFANSDE